MGDFHGLLRIAIDNQKYNCYPQKYQDLTKLKKIGPKFSERQKMNLPDRMRRIIALCLLIGWVSLFGVSLSQELESLEDQIESSDDPAEKAISLPISQSIDPWDEFEDVSKSTGLKKSILLMDFGLVHRLRASFIVPGFVNPQHHRLSYGPKLFKFLSTYRL